MEMLTSNSTYFSTSEPKAKLMTRYSREMTLINSDSSDLTKKKVSRGNEDFMHTCEMYIFLEILFYVEKSLYKKF